VDLVVTFLGTAASVPTRGRSTAATVVARGGERWLFDCGEGTQRQFLRSGLGLVDLDLILLTHLHGDHFLGLPGMIKTFGLRGRDRPLRVVGPRGLRELLERLGAVIGRTPYPLQIDEVGPGTVHTTDGAVIEAFPTDHGVPSLGYALVEEPRPGVFDVAAATALGVPAGPLFGRLQHGEAITLDDGTAVTPAAVLGPARRGRRVVISGDTRPCESTLGAATDADLLIHEATFLADERDRALDTRHSTAREAATLARDAGVQLVALTHLSSRCMPREIRAEAEAIFPKVVVPRDFDQIELPFRERGEPRLHRADGDGVTHSGAPDTSDLSQPAPQPQESR
jgi:ribonuclease Z